VVKDGDEDEDGLRLVISQHQLAQFYLEEDDPAQWPDHDAGHKDDSYSDSGDDDDSGCDTQPPSVRTYTRAGTRISSEALEEERRGTRRLASELSAEYHHFPLPTPQAEAALEQMHLRQVARVARARADHGTLTGGDLVTSEVVLAVATVQQAQGKPQVFPGSDTHADTASTEEAATRIQRLATSSTLYLAAMLECAGAIAADREHHGAPWEHLYRDEKYKCSNFASYAIKPQEGQTPRRDNAPSPLDRLPITNAHDLEVAAALNGAPGFELDHQPRICAPFAWHQQQQKPKMSNLLQATLSV
jgi:hypothetical protein